MKKIILCAAAMLVAFGAMAQTAEELKAEREALASELTSKDAVKKAKSIAKKVDELVPIGGNLADLVDGMLAFLPDELKSTCTQPIYNLMEGKDSRVVNKPASVGLSSVDGLVNSVSPLLATAVSTNDILAEYRTEIIDNGNGEVDITKYKAKSSDYVALVPILAQATVEAAKAAEQLKSVKDDLSKLNPMQAAPAIKAGKWIGDAIDITTYKLAETTKLLTNLTQSLKAAENL